MNFFLNASLNHQQKKLILFIISFIILAISAWFFHRSFILLLGCIVCLYLVKNNFISDKKYSYDQTLKLISTPLNFDYKVRNKKQLLLVLSMVFLSILTSIVALYIMHRFELKDLVKVNHTDETGVFAFIKSVVIAPLGEEFFYRSCLFWLLLFGWYKLKKMTPEKIKNFFPILKNKKLSIILGALIYIILTSYIFAIEHDHKKFFLQSITFIHAICWSILYFHTKSLFFPVVCHFMNNFAENTTRYMHFVFIAMVVIVFIIVLVWPRKTAKTFEK